MIDLTPVILAVIALCGVVASVAALPLLRAKLGAERTEELLSWVRVAVAAAEQLYKSASGPQKKERVIAFLRGQGFDVNEAEVDKAIEAAVLELHNTLYGTIGTKPSKAGSGRRGGATKRYEAFAKGGSGVSAVCSDEEGGGSSGSG